MALINHAKREINAKLVYYGPAGSGKFSLFRYIHQRIKPSLCGPLRSMPAGDDTLVFFDYLPFEQASLGGYRIRFHLYTLTGPVHNPATWRMVLKGVDGMALVAESGGEQGDEAVQALQSLQAMLDAHGRDLRKIPLVLLSTKADQPQPEPPAWGDALVGITSLHCSSITGAGVLQGLTSLSQEVFLRLREEQAAAANLPAGSDEAVGGAHAAAAVQNASVEEMEQGAVHELQPGKAVTLRLPVILSDLGGQRQLSLRVTLALEGLPDNRGRG